MSLKVKNVFSFLRVKKALHIDIQSCSSKSDTVIIPKRISRSSTDILRALSNTVQRDPTAAHYKFHDDPYLIPYSNLSKRSYALSQEAGRKAAYWVRQQHSDLFQHKVAEPLIEKYVPKPDYNELSEVNEEDLLNAINNTFVSDAVLIYNLLKNKGIDINSNLKLQLLEFLCFYNSEDPISEDWIEEKWYRLNISQANLKNTWKDGGLAEQIFRDLKSTEFEAAAYSALISGMCSYGQIEMAFMTYEESKEKQISLNVHAYNALLSKVYAIKENHSMIWSCVEDLLKEMSGKNISPDIRTLNAVLETLSTMVTNKASKELALSIISEFKQIGVEPSLASFYHLINLYMKEKKKLAGLLYSILNYCHNKKFTIRDPLDTKFFVRAMEICLKSLHNKDLGYRLHEILHYGDNYNLIGDSFRESQY